MDKISETPVVIGGLAVNISTGAVAMLNADMIYEAADYLRLSKEDGDFSLSNDKLESDSISSQRAIIERFVAQNPNIKLVAEFCDDGYTGTNFVEVR